MTFVNATFSSAGYGPFSQFPAASTVTAGSFAIATDQNFATYQAQNGSWVLVLGVTSAVQALTITGTPSSGQVLTATGPTGAGWATPAGSPSVTSVTQNLVITGTPTSGQVLTATGSGGANWQVAAGPNLTESRTFALQGTVTTASVPTFFEPVDTGVTKKLTKVRYVLGSGTATVAVQQNAGNVTGLTALAVSPGAGATSPGAPPTVNDGDQFGIVVSGIPTSSTASNLSVSPCTTCRPTNTGRP